MEVLDSVWSVLITEDKIATKVITAPAIIFELWLGFLLFTTILKITYSKKQKLIHIIFLSHTSLITVFFIPAPFNVIINYGIMFIFIKNNLKLNIIKTILCIIIPTVIFALVGILILKPILLIFDISAEQAQYTPIYDIIYLIFMYTIIFVLIKFIQNNNFKLILKEEFNSHNKKVIFLNLFLGLFTLCVQLTITAFYTDVLPVIINLFSFIFLFAYFFISLYSLTKTMNLQIATRSLESAENYNNTLSILYDNVKSFKHDFDNIVYTIGGYINTDDMEGLKEYYIDLEKDCERVNNISLLNPQIINNAGIYNLLMAKYKKAHELNVDINLEFFFDFNKLKMPIYEFSRILGILLDNAIEASSENNNKKVNLIFRDSTNRHIQTIIIENTYNNKDVDKIKIFEKGITGKNNHSGMGLWEVNQIVIKNNNVKLITENNDLYFTQQLEIYY